MMSPPSFKQTKRRRQESPAAAKVMHLDLMLKNIGSFLPSTDLRSLRRTCTFWNRAFVPSHRKKHASISLTNASSTRIDEQIAVYRRDLGRTNVLATLAKHPGASLANFNGVMRKSQLVPFGNYELTLEPPETPDGLRREDPLEEFVALCGSSARSIAIWSIIHASHFDMNQIRTLNFDQLPNLSVLNYQLQYQRSHTDDTAATSRVAGQTTLKLTKLTLRSPYYYGLVGARPFTDAENQFLIEFTKGLITLKTLVIQSGSFAFLSILRKYAPRLENMKRLELVKMGAHSSVGLTTAENLEILNELANQKQNQLRLKEFSFTIGPNNEEKDAIDVDFANKLYEFLTSQCGSLHLLEIRANTSGHDRTISSQVRIPVMANLREFRFLRSGRDRHRFLQFDALTMTENFPSLQKYAYQNKSKCDIELASEHEESREDDLSDMEIMGHQGARATGLELSVALPKAWAELGVLRRFGEGCPSVVHLTLTISMESVGDSLGIIWGTWPLLETATIKFHNHSRDVRGGGENVAVVDTQLDKALSGVPVPSSRSEMNQLLSNLMTLDDVCSRLAEYKTGPGLSDMTRLWKLVLDFSTVSSRPILGDVGGYFGLVTAGQRRLQHFSVIQMKDEPCTPSAVSISRECEALVRSSMGPRAELNL